MSKLRLFILLTTLLFVSSATAQEPVLHVEHSWGFHMGDHWYGLSQWRLYGADSKSRTTVSLGRPLFTVKMPATALIAIVFVPLVGFVLALIGTRPLQKGRV